MMSCEQGLSAKKYISTQKNIFKSLNWLYPLLMKLFSSTVIESC